MLCVGTSAVPGNTPSLGGVWGVSAPGLLKQLGTHGLLHLGRIMMANHLEDIGEGVTSSGFISTVGAQTGAATRQERISIVQAGLAEVELTQRVSRRATYRLDPSVAIRYGGNGVILFMATETGHQVVLKICCFDSEIQVAPNPPCAVRAMLYFDGGVQIMERATVDMHELLNTDPGHSAVARFPDWAAAVAAEMLRDTDGVVCPDWKLANCGWFDGTATLRVLDVDGMYTDTTTHYAIQATHASVPVEEATDDDDYDAMATGVVATAFAVEATIAIVTDQRVASDASWRALLVDPLVAADLSRTEAARAVATRLADKAVETDVMAVCGALTVLGIYSSWARALGDGGASLGDFCALKWRLRSYFESRGVY